MKYLGVDWGLKKIGLAVSYGEIASPYKTLEIKGLKDGVEKIRMVVEKENIDIVIMGKPEGEMGKMVKAALKMLSNLKVPVIAADETLTTVGAKTLMLEMGIGKKARRDDNSTAASIILQRYLDEEKI